MDPVFRGMEPVRPQSALTVRRRAAFGAADVVLGALWVFGAPRLIAALPARFAVIAVAQALVVWGVVECIRGFTPAGSFWRVVAVLAATFGVLVVLFGVLLVVFIVTGGWETT